MGALKKTERNYGIDLLRMFAMYLIAVLHVLGQGGVLAATSGAKNDAAWILEIGAYCCVNCYALISGYVGLNSKFKYTNIIMLWLNVLFYTVGITLMFSIFMPDAVRVPIGEDELFLISPKWDYALFPVSEKEYWYFTAYVLCYFFTPILNKAVLALERKQLKKAIIALLIIFSVPYLYTDRDVFGSGYGYSGLWLIVLYLVGAYMKKYNSLSHLSKLQALAGYISCISLTWGSMILIENYLPNFGRSNILIHYISPTIIASAVFLLVLFRQMSLGRRMRKIIGFFAPLSFSVYIIHVHPLVWKYIMAGLFKPIGKLSIPLMMLSVVGASLGLYLTCSLIDVVRFYLFKLLRLQKLVFFLETKITEKFAKKDKEDDFYIEYNYDFEYPEEEKKPEIEPDKKPEQQPEKHKKAAFVAGFGVAALGAAAIAIVKNQKNKNSKK